MPREPKQPKAPTSPDDLPSWEIYDLKGSPARMVAWARAKDAENALAEAIKQFGLKDDPSRFIAVRGR
jgi:hypothetical protein